MRWLFAVCLLLRATTAAGDSTASRSLAVAANDSADSETLATNSSVDLDTETTTLTSTEPSTTAQLSTIVLTTTTLSVSTPPPNCSASAADSSRIKVALGTAVLIPCPPSTPTAKYKSVTWTHTPSGSYISRLSYNLVLPSLTRRFYFAKDGASLVVVSAREGDSFQCTLFVSEGDCRSATISIDVQRCQSAELNPCANGGNCSIVLAASPVAAVDCLCVYGYRGPRCNDAISRGVWLIILFWIFILLEVVLVFTGAYRYLQLRRVSTESTGGEDIPIYKLLATITES